MVSGDWIFKKYFAKSELLCISIKQRFQNGFNPIVVKGGGSDATTNI